MQYAPLPIVKPSRQARDKKDTAKLIVIGGLSVVTSALALTLTGNPDTQAHPVVTKAPHAYHIKTQELFNAPLVKGGTLTVSVTKDGKDVTAYPCEVSHIPNPKNPTESLTVCTAKNVTFEDETTTYKYEQIGVTSAAPGTQHRFDLTFKNANATLIPTTNTNDYYKTHDSFCLDTAYDKETRTFGPANAILASVKPGSIKTQFCATTASL